MRIAETTWLPSATPSFGSSELWLAADPWVRGAGWGRWLEILGGCSCIGLLFHPSTQKLTLSTKMAESRGGFGRGRGGPRGRRGRRGPKRDEDKEW